MKKCVFAGTFDPPTTGHERIIKTCLKIFDEAVVAVMINSAKQPLLSADERKTLLELLFRGDSRVKVVVFEGAAVDLLKQENTPFYVRGIRNTIDFEYENRDNFASKKLSDDFIPIYLPAEQEELHVSSTLVRNSIKFNKDYSAYIPEAIRDEFEKMIRNKTVGGDNV